MGDDKRSVFEIIKTAADVVNQVEQTGESGQNKLNSAVGTLMSTLQENSSIPEMYLNKDFLTNLIDIIVLIINIITKRDWGQVFTLGGMVFNLIKSL